jgi:hypothetical protein
MLAVKLGFAGPELADSATGYQRLMHWITQNCFRILRSPAPYSAPVRRGNPGRHAKPAEGVHQPLAGKR